jgi:ferrochelatase
MTTFQSRFGREEWLKPYTDETLKGLPQQGIKSLQMVCPGFSSDCLETIEEIGEENREYFMEAGGERYEYIECLNSDDAHLDMLFNLLEANMQGWRVGDDYQQREQLAKAMGASK